ncbi:hypothetical protein NEOLI_000341 [Neolecta irregularis DAH-3]|uniref:Nucleolar pre-ribosomal-associated protein 1 n=1 Tax=Neolecta irregularis (strain DAH-3) TaxID=1198029 RepID=A0A1U7LVL0_NEOID|nr:hypothetical protein NEOLI_000341 [Neolecta irregularis DAH-3]|eukprot:OLL26710.1 hypothetical protein NEOLI_000341 [Neolecta irregularis DAH-3]
MEQNVQDLKLLLRQQSYEPLRKDLQTFRQIARSAETEEHHKNLLVHFVEQESPWQDLLHLWDSIYQLNYNNIFPIFPSLLRNILYFLSNSPELHKKGNTLIHMILEDHIKLIYRNLNSNRPQTISPTLDLLLSMVAFAEGKFSRDIFGALDWTLKFWGKLLGMKQTQPSREVGEPDAKRKKFDHPDVRTRMIKLVFSLLKYGHALEVLGMRGLMTPLIKGVKEDEAWVVKQVFDGLKDIVADRETPRSFKISFFNEWVLGQLSQLYLRQDEIENSLSVASITHSFFIALCTHPNIGVCFQDSGWYPQKYVPGKFSTNLYNKILSSFVLSLKPFENVHHAELLLAICKSCPELIAHITRHTTISLELKSATKAIATFALLEEFVNMPIPSQEVTFNTPPPVEIILENVLPAVINRTVLAKAFGHENALIRLFSARLLIAALTKLQLLGLWLHENFPGSEDTFLELSDSITKRVPDLNMIIYAFSSPATEIPSTSEVRLHLISLYNEVIPEFTSLQKFDPTPIITATICQSATTSVEQTYAFRILKIMENVKWWHKSTASSPLIVVLRAWFASNDRDTRVLAENVLNSWFKESMAFQTETVVPAISPLLSSLSILTNEERDVCFKFLEDCVARCFRSPFKYLDRAAELYVEEYGNTKQPKYISPLVLTIVEQRPFAESNLSTLEQKSLRRWIGVFLEHLMLSGEDGLLLSKAVFNLKGKFWKTLRRILSNWSSKSEDNNPTHHICCVCEKGGICPMLEDLVKGLQSPCHLGFYNEVLRVHPQMLKILTPVDVLRHINLGVHKTDDTNFIKLVKDYFQVASNSLDLFAVNIITRRIVALSKACETNTDRIVEINTWMDFFRSIWSSWQVQSNVGALHLWCIIFGDDQIMLKMAFPQTLGDHINFELARQIALMLDEVGNPNERFAELLDYFDNFSLAIVDGKTFMDKSRTEMYKTIFSIFVEHMAVSRCFLLLMKIMNLNSVATLSTSNRDENCLQAEIASSQKSFLTSTTNRQRGEPHIGRCFLERHYNATLPLIRSLREQSRLNLLRCSLEDLTLSGADVIVGFFGDDENSILHIAQYISTADFSGAQVNAFLTLLALCLKGHIQPRGNDIELNNSTSEVVHACVVEAIRNQIDFLLQELSSINFLHLPVFEKLFIIYPDGLKSKLTKMLKKSTFSRKETIVIKIMASQIGPEGGSRLLHGWITSSLDIITRRFAQDPVLSEDVVDFIDAFVNILRSDFKFSLDARVVNPVFETGLRSHITLKQTAELLLALTVFVDPNELNTSRALQIIFGHPPEKIFQTLEPPSALRRDIALLLHQLYFISPKSNATVSTLEGLLQLYNGSIDEADTSILAMIVDIESIRGESVAISHKPFDVKSSTAIFDSKRILKSIYNFPIEVDRSQLNLSDIMASRTELLQETELKASIYDPVLLLSMIAMFLKQHEPNQDFRKLIESNAFGYILICLSSTEKNILKMAYNILEHLWYTLETSKFREQGQITLIFTLLRNTFSEEEGLPTRISSAFATFLAIAPSVLLNPGHMMYEKLNKFLLQRPVFDIQDIPMLYSIIYTDEDWQKEVCWFLEILASGVKCYDDFEHFCKRHIFEWCFELYESHVSSSSVKNLVVLLLERAGLIREVRKGLETRYGMVSWLKLHGQDEKLRPLCEAYELE